MSDIASLERSRLLSLVPIGRATGAIEALSSYLIRLAAAHDINLADLMRRVLPREVDGTIPVTTAEQLLSSSAHTINGATPTAQRYSDLVSAATLRDVHDLTALRFEGAFAPARLTRKTVHWCPACLGESEHELLAWSLLDVDACAKHGLELATTCPTCGAAQRPLATNAHIGRCRRCDDGLATAERREASSWDLWVARQVDALLAMTDEIPGQVQVLKSALVHARLTPTALARASNVAVNTIRYWANGEGLPSLGVAVRVAAALETTLPGLMRSTFEPSLLEVDIPSTTWTVRVTHNPGVQRAVLESALTDPTCPSLRAVAIKLRAHPQDLRRAWPDLTSQIVERRRAKRETDRLERGIGIEAKVVEVVRDLKERGITPSRRAVERHLGGYQVREGTVGRAWRALVDEETAA